MGPRHLWELFDAHAVWIVFCRLLFHFVDVAIMFDPASRYWEGHCFKWIEMESSTRFGCRYGWIAQRVCSFSIDWLNDSWVVVVACSWKDSCWGKEWPICTKQYNVYILFLFYQLGYLQVYCWTIKVPPKWCVKSSDRFCSFCVFAQTKMIISNRIVCAWIRLIIAAYRLTFAFNSLECLEF